MSKRDLGPTDALVIVDPQVDFFAGGALPVADAERIVPVLNDWIERASSAGALVVLTRECHPPNHSSFRRHGGRWPAHCVVGSEGAAFHPDLLVPENAVIIDKADRPELDVYSGFAHTDLGERLRTACVDRLWVGGLALDVCVLYTVLDACGEGFEVHVIASATRAVEVTPGDGERALESMREAGALIEEP